MKFQQTTADKDAERDLKWARMLHPTKGFDADRLLARRWRKGVPRGWRRAAWQNSWTTGPQNSRRPRGPGKRISGS